MKNDTGDGLALSNNEKGRTVVTTKIFKEEEFVCWYSGDLISKKEQKERELVYEKNNEGCYILEFVFKGEKSYIDATRETTNFGRLINHSRKGNVKPNIFSSDGRPFVYFESICEIMPGKELLYDYGDRRRDVVKSLPWMKM